MSDLTRLQWLFRHHRFALSPSSTEPQQIFFPLPRRLGAPLLITGLLMTGLTGCTVLEQFGLDGTNGSSEPTEAVSNSVALEESTPAPPTPTEVVSPPESSAEPAPNPALDSAPENSAPAPDTYPDAIKKATLALTLSESAQSTDDWALVAGRWQQAIDLMNAVPTSSENYNSVPAKITDYRRKRDAAKVKANQPIPTSSPLGRIVVVSEDENAVSAPTSEGENNDDTSAEGTSIAANPTPQTPVDSLDEEKAAEDGLYLAPIVRRSGGTPVIHVEFNNRYTVEMIVDTGASGTVLTQQVAQTLGIEPIGQTNMATASAQSVPFLLGRVTSMEVQGAVLENSVVAIAGPDLATGLLGNDFFKDYDVTVKADVVEFRER